MVSSNVWIAGVVVPPVCLILGAVLGMVWWRKAKRLLKQREDEDGGSLPRTTPTPKTRPHSESNYDASLNRLDLSSISLPSPFLHVASSPTPPPSPAPPPSPSATSIHTSINRKGSRVLAKRKRPTSTGSRSRKGSSSAAVVVPALDDDAPMPASTRQVAQYGTGEWGDYEGYEEMGTTDESGSHEQWVIGRAVSIDEMREGAEGFASPGRQASLLRRRSITWTTQELENTVSMVERPAPSRPSLGPQQSSSSNVGKVSSESKDYGSSSAEAGGSTRNLLEHDATERYYSERSAPLRDHTNVPPPDRRRSVTTSAPQPFPFVSNVHLPSASSSISYVKPYSTTITFSPTPILAKRSSDPRRHSNPLDSRAMVRASYSSADLYSIAPALTIEGPYSRYSTATVHSSFREPSSKRASLAVPGVSQTAPPSPSRSQFSSNTFGDHHIGLGGGGGKGWAQEDIGRGVADALEELRAPVRPRLSWLARADSSGTLPKTEKQERLVLANPDNSPPTTTRSSYDFHRSSLTISPSFANISHASH